MTWLVALAIVGVIVSLAVVVRRPVQRGKVPPFQPLPVSLLGLDDSDAAELFEMGRRVEQEFGLRPSTATELLQALQAADLIRREPDPADARRKCIVCTEKAE